MKYEETRRKVDKLNLTVSEVRQHQLSKTLQSAVGKLKSANIMGKLGKG